MIDDNNGKSDEAERLFPTFADAIRGRKERIAELCEGDKADRCLAKVLARCRKGSRCHREDCAVCMRRGVIAKNRIPESAVEMHRGSPVNSFWLKDIKIEAIKVEGKRRALNEKELRRLMASMHQDTMRTPITVRTKGKGKVILVAGLHRLEAARRLGWKAIHCFVDDASSELEARWWQIAENLHRAELTALERAEGIDELRILILLRLKGGQVAPPGGKQPKHSGIKKTAKTLRLTREDVRRSKRIAGISADAKAEAKKLGLDDNQSVLLTIAKLPTAGGQVEAAREIDARKRAELSRLAAAAAEDNEEAAAEIEAIDADIETKKSKIERLKRAVSSKRKHRHQIESKLVKDCVDTAAIPTTESPPAAPTDDLDAEPGEAANDQPFDVLLAVREDATQLRQVWESAPSAVRRRFVREVLCEGED
jgi:ParB-like chromosome segregation protein Spo0J